MRMSKTQLMLTSVFFVFVATMVSLICFPEVFFNEDNAPAKIKIGDTKKVTVLREDLYEIVMIDGYTYYSVIHGLAPTPETIKRCIREVKDEIKESD